MPPSPSCLPPERSLSFLTCCPSYRALSLAASLARLFVSECRTVRLRASAWVTLGKAMERVPEEEGRGDSFYRCCLDLLHTLVILDFGGFCWIPCLRDTRAVLVLVASRRLSAGTLWEDGTIRGCRPRERDRSRPIPSEIAVTYNFQHLYCDVKHGISLKIVHRVDGKHCIRLIPLHGQIVFQ